MDVKGFIGVEEIKKNLKKLMEFKEI